MQPKNCSFDAIPDGRIESGDDRWIVRVFESADWMDRELRQIVAKRVNEGCEVVFEALVTVDG